MTPNLYSQPRRSSINPKHRLARGFTSGFLHNFGAGEGLPARNLGTRTDLHASSVGWLNATGITAKAPYKTFHVDRIASATPGYVSGTGTTSVVVPSGADCCAFVLFFMTNVVTAGSQFVLRSSASGNPIIGLYVGNNGATAAADKFIPLCRDDAGTLVQETTGVTVDDSLWHFAVVQRQGGVWSWSVDGSAFTSMGTASGALTLTPDRISYGIDIVSGAGIEKPQGDFAMGGFSIGYSLGRAEVATLARNPWQLFAAPKRRLALNSAAAGATGGPFPHYTRRMLTGGMPVGVM